MEINQQELFIKYNQKYLDFDGVFQNQCVDIIKAYFVEVLKRSPIQGNAIDYWRDIPGFERISKGLFNRPNPGDLIIWDTQYNQYGHIAICNWSRFMDLGVFEQNNPIKSPCHFNIHKYHNILGWLRPAKRLEVPLSLAFVNNPGTDIVNKIKEYLPVEFEINTYLKPINVPSGTLTTDSAMRVIDELGVREPFCFIFYPPNPDSAYEVASIYPKKNVAFCTIPQGNPLTIPVHAFLHLLRKHINFNKIKPYIEDKEFYPTNWSDMGNFDNLGWKFQEQYNEIKKYL